MNRNKILHAAVETFGRDSQMMMMVEEMSELTKAISKFFRATSAGDEQAVDAAEMSIREEMADVQIMLDQMKIMFGYTNMQERKKLVRLEKRIAEYKGMEV